VEVLCNLGMVNLINEEEMWIAVRKIENKKQ
jgi:hypothetical protein